MTRKIFHSGIPLALVILVSLGCNIFTGTPQPQPMGTFKIINDHIRGSDAFPGGNGLPDYREYGVCFISYPPVAGLTTPTNDMILAKDEQQRQETTYALPAGTYTLQEFQFDSEINQDPLYLPAMRTLVRPVETIVLGADQIITFGSERSLSAPGEFVEGNPINPNCGGGSEGTGVFPTETSEIPTDTPESTTGTWVLKLIQPDVGKTEVTFSFPGLNCNGGTVVTSTETSASTTTTGTCQVNGALVANQITQHSWSRPSDQLTPGQEITGSLTASSSGLCSWTGATTEENCRPSVTTSHTVWQGDGWPGGQVEFPYQNLIYGNDYYTQARASDKPTGSYQWVVPEGTYGGKTLVLQYCSSSSGGKVYTNFWYEWQGP